MQPALEIDTRQWRKAAVALLRTSSRSCVDFTNGQGLKVSIEAVRQTRKADDTKIAHVLGAIGRGVSFKARTRNTSKGVKGSIRVIKGQHIVKDDSFAERILGVRFKKLGKWHVKGSTMEERAQNLIKARVVSSQFMQSGWIPARRKLFSVVNQKPPGTGMTFEGARQRGKPKGDATPAVNAGLKSLIVCVIKNTALNATPIFPATGGDPMPEAKKGLQAALNISARDMMDTLAKRLGRDLKPFNSKR